MNSNFVKVRETWQCQICGEDVEHISNMCGMNLDEFLDEHFKGHLLGESEEKHERERAF